MIFEIITKGRVKFWDGFSEEKQNDIKETIKGLLFVVQPYFSPQKILWVTQDKGRLAQVIA